MGKVRYGTVLQVAYYYRKDDKVPPNEGWGGPDHLKPSFIFWVPFSEFGLGEAKYRSGVVF